ncbi:hypothetical protein O4N75_15340 [Phenylobacterium sp. NIBR 498073]|nr:hypothetical protein [Phenylobacterium sp. NIBR 498073]WGU39014.1 hypothetical protein O4N75_15340 [Phenylobacterium sp. NIBR 498073]
MVDTECDPQEISLDENVTRSAMHPADQFDRRAVLVGVEAYEAAGGRVTRDLFTEDRGGWLDDVALLDQLALDQLQALADEVVAREG